MQTQMAFRQNIDQWFAWAGLYEEGFSIKRTYNYRKDGSHYMTYNLVTPASHLYSAIGNLHRVPGKLGEQMDTRKVITYPLSRQRKNEIDLELNSKGANIHEENPF